MSAFFEELEDQYPSKETPEHHSYAEKFHSLARDTFGYLGRWSRKRWARKVRLLFSGVKDQDRVRRVLDWYLAQAPKRAREQGFPRILSPEALRSPKLFDWVERLMKAQEPEVEISPEAQRAAKRLSMRHWPKGTKDQLPRVVQISIDRIRAFRKRLESIADDRIHIPLGNGRYKSNPNRLGLSANYVLKKLRDPVYFAEVWLEDANDRIQNWEAWSGKIMTLAFKADSERMTSICKGWVSDYCGKPQLWDSIMEKLDEDR